ncbi:hypothetical protein UCD39_03300 [Nitrospirillum sp. BR 11752]|uniref:hypothetical protein n=1 Tax=Nitrospirillum sp. BR 11752 TaxID=3104293 RepID=UPI002EA91398|nr:hypothetical protein [Nitrospirillum sp. BR 11752]
MTYCFAFIDPGSGIGFVTDRRVVTMTKFGDISVVTEDAIKVVAINNRAIVAVAGDVNLLSALTFDLDIILMALNPKNWHEVFKKEMRKRYQNLMTFNPELRGCTAQIIFAMARTSKSKKVFNLLRMEFGFRNNSCHIGVGAGCTYAAIGTSPQIRKRLNDAAIYNLNDLYEKRITVRSLTQEEWHGIKNLNEMRNASDEPPIDSYMIDSTGGRPFPHVMNEISRGMNRAALNLNSTLMLAMAASKAIGMENMAIKEEGAEYGELVGDSWQISTLRIPEGFKIGDTAG